jgi:hypothetical protein
MTGQLRDRRVAFKSHPVRTLLTLSEILTTLTLSLAIDPSFPQHPLADAHLY